MAKPNLRKVNFEDQGQDLLWLIINAKGRVIQAGPFHNGMYQGAHGEVVRSDDGKRYFMIKVMPRPLASGHRLQAPATFKWPVKRITKPTGNERNFS